MRRLPVVAGSPVSSRGVRLELADSAAGTTEYRQRNQRTGQLEYLDAELFCDVDHPARRYVSIAGSPLIPLQEDGRTDEATPLPGRSFTRYGNRQPATRDLRPPDPAPRSIV